MKLYQKIMKVITVLEEAVLTVSMTAIVILAFGNVVARKIFSHAWNFADEINVAVFVLISLLGAGLAAREQGGLVNLSLLPDHTGPTARKILNTIVGVIGIAFSVLLSREGYGRMRASAGTSSPILHIPQAVFWSFILIGGISLALHFLENIILFWHRDLAAEDEARKKEEQEAGIEANEEEAEARLEEEEAREEREEVREERMEEKEKKQEKKGGKQK